MHDSFKRELMNKLEITFVSTEQSYNAQLYNVQINVFNLKGKTPNYVMRATFYG